MIECKRSLVVLLGNHHCHVFLSSPAMDGALTATLSGSAASLGDSLPVFSHFVSSRKAFQYVLLCLWSYLNESQERLFTAGLWKPAQMQQRWRNKDD